MTNSLGRYVQGQLGLLGLSREALAEHAGIDSHELDTILESPLLARWPDPAVMASLARTLGVEVRDVVLNTARACGLEVDAVAETAVSVEQVGNEALMCEVRRRLALGAAVGGYLSTRSDWRLGV